jgi:hypothetical protein
LTSAVCEEFGCTPDEADEQDPVRCKEIMALRRYRDIHHLVSGGTKQADLPDCAATERYLRVQRVLAHEEFDAR